MLAEEEGIGEMDDGGREIVGGVVGGVMDGVVDGVVDGGRDVDDGGCVVDEEVGEVVELVWEDEGEGEVVEDDEDDGLDELDEPNELELDELEPELDKLELDEPDSELELELDPDSDVVVDADVVVDPSAPPLDVDVAAGDVDPPYCHPSPRGMLGP